MEQSLLRWWKRLGGSAAGRALFSRMLGFVVPYSGSVRPLVVDLTPGSATVEIRERRFVRNHLRSIHAIALANVGELASGLANLTALPVGVRAIVVKLEIEYLKKARGTLRALGSANPPDVILEPIDMVANAEIFDSAGDIVARVAVTWRLAPRK